MATSTVALIRLAGAVLGSCITAFFAHFKEKGNRKNALELKKLEIVGQYNQRWFEDRREAHAKLLNVTSTVSTKE